GQQPVQQLGPDPDHLSHPPQRTALDRLGDQQPTILAREPDGIHASAHQRRHDPLVRPARKHHDRHIQRLRRRDPAPARPCDRHPEPAHERAHLRTTAVHHDDGIPYMGKVTRQLREPDRVTEVPPTDLQDAHVHSRRPSRSSSPSARFAFCTACPAAPFTRLSSAATTSRAGASNPSTVEKPSETTFRPTTSRSEGSRVPSTSMKGSPSYASAHTATASDSLNGCSSGRRIVSRIPRRTGNRCGVKTNCTPTPPPTRTSPRF